jgi:uncharacterized pyridoxal phosphate-containing UPF0001 family protein
LDFREIRENYQKIRSEIPSYINIVVAAKTRTAAEIKEVIEAGATDIGENYVQEVEKSGQPWDGLCLKKLSGI